MPSDPGSNAFLFASPEYSILASLHKNEVDFTDLQLWLNASSNVPDLIDALWQNTTVREVSLLIHESFAEQAEREVLFLFSTMGRLPKLKRLSFNTYRFHFEAILPIRSFTNVFRSNRRLVEFKLWRTELCLSHYNVHETTATSGEEQISEWAQALERCRCLREFRLIKCKLAKDTLHPSEEESDDDIHNNSLLDPLLQALGKLSTLKIVELSAAKASALGSLSEKGLSQLMRSSSLESLSLCNLDLSEAAAVTIGRGLIPKAQMATSSTSNTIKQQYTPSHPTVTTSCSPIKHLRLTGAGSTVSVFPKSIRDSFRTALHSNYRLETLHLFDAHNLRDEISFYLKLNRHGRSHLMLDNNVGSRKEWVETLVQVVEDLDCLFYFLRVNPLLCGCGGEN